MLVKKRQTGFTLIEIAIVLVIIGLLVGSFIGTFANRIDATRRADVKNELKDIKEILMAFAYSQGTEVHLPCPDTDTPPDGEENRVSGVCDPGGSLGTLPWLTIGIGREDAWATHYRYWVNDDYASNTGFSLNEDDDGASATIKTRVNDSNVDIVENAVAVIFSHGKNRLGGVSVNGINQAAIPGSGRDDEAENGDGGTVYMVRPPSMEGAATTGGVFDDVLIWINSYELKAKMVEAGKLP